MMEDNKQIDIISMRLSHAKISDSDIALGLETSQKLLDILYSYPLEGKNKRNIQELYARYIPPTNNNEK